MVAIFFTNPLLGILLCTKSLRLQSLRFTLLKTTWMRRKHSFPCGLQVWGLLGRRLGHLSPWSHTFPGSRPTGVRCPCSQAGLPANGTGSGCGRS